MQFCSYNRTDICRMLCIGCIRKWPHCIHNASHTHAVTLMTTAYNMLVAMNPHDTHNSKSGIEKADICTSYDVSTTNKVHLGRQDVELVYINKLMIMKGKFYPRIMHFWWTVMKWRLHLMEKPKLLSNLNNVKLYTQRNIS